MSPDGLPRMQPLARFPAAARLLLAEVFGIDLDRDQAAFVFAGDSLNDAPMFGFFENAVGVANVVDFLDQLSAKPTWVTTRSSGAGFAELAEALLAARTPERNG